jgi:7-cyano-7-deazaguanine synthase
MKPSTVRSEMPVPRAVALLSGGLDSTVSLALAARKVDVLAAVTFRYGQRSADEEVKASRRIARRLGVPHRVISLPWLGRLPGGALTDRQRKIPKVRATDLKTGKTRRASRSVWVPNRNGLFLNVAACLAEAWNAAIIVAGFNREEADNFPDNSPEFVRDVNRALKRSTLKGVRVVSYVQRMNKEEMVKAGLEAGAPLEVVYSCYEGGPQHCGQCESCRRLARAFRSAGQWKRIQPRFGE